MIRIKSLITLSIGCASLLVGSLCFAAATLEPVTIGYSTFSGAYLPLWIAVEERLGRKHDLDLKAIYAGRIRPQQLLASGEVPFVMASGTGALTSHILGVKDQVIVMTTMNKVNSAIFSRGDIKTAEELRGKTIATGRPGAFGEMMVRYVLRAKLGLVPDRDVKLLPIGEAQLAFPALERGIVQAASLTIPFTLDRQEDRLSRTDRLRYGRCCISVQHSHDAAPNAGQESRLDREVFEDDDRRNLPLQDR